MSPPEDWPRLASYVISARVAAGHKDRRSFARTTGVSERTIGNLERGVRVSPDVVAAVENAIGWKPGSGRAVLGGGEPASVTGNSTPERQSGRPPDPDGYTRPVYSDPDLEAFARALEARPDMAPMLHRDIDQAVQVMAQRKRMLSAEARVAELERENAALRAELAQGRPERQGALPAASIPEP